MSGQTERQRQIGMLLRQLAVGLSAYRLFPGDIEQSAFVSAVGRIQEAAKQPLAAGPVALEIRGRAFVTTEGPFPEDETTYRLAVACYERRVEHLRMNVAPAAEELAAVYEALTRPVDEVAAAGGVETLLGRAGVTSFSLTQIEPHAIDAVVDAALLAPELATMWEQLQEEAALDVIDLEGNLSETAAEVLARFRALVAALPPDAAEDPELYRRLHRAVTTLPKQVRRDLVGLLIDESPSELVAARMVGSITDHQLGELLVELGEDGESDAIELARDLVARRSRQEGLVELVRDLKHGGTSAAAPEMPLAPEDPGTVRAAVGEIVGGGAAQSESARAVRLGFPETPDDLRAQALATLRDYLAAEEDQERLKRVLDLWLKKVRASLLEGGANTAALVEVVEAALARARDDEARRAIFTACKRRILEIPFLQELLGPDMRANTDRIVELLDPLGETAVEGLLGVLGEETDRSRRSALVSMLAGFAGRYSGPVEARLNDDRWYVVRNAVNILHKAEGGRERVAILERASSHPHAAVRREVIWGLVSVLGADAAPHMRPFVTDRDSTVRERAVGFLGGLDSPEAIELLADVARSPGDRSLRRRALDEIAHNPSAGSPGLLRELSLFRTRPRLPWALRRHARKLMRERGAS